MYHFHKLVFRSSIFTNNIQNKLRKRPCHFGIHSHKWKPIINISLNNWNWPLIEICGGQACWSLTAIALTAPSSKNIKIEFQPRLGKHFKWTHDDNLWPEFHTCSSRKPLEFASLASCSVSFEILKLPEISLWPSKCCFFLRLLLPKEYSKLKTSAKVSGKIKVKENLWYCL